MLNKRGEHTEHMIWPVVVMVLVIVIIFFGLGEKIHHLGDSDSLLSNYFARDIALLVDTAGATVNDVSFEYPHDLSGFKVTLAEDEVRVEKGDGEGKYPVSNPTGLHIIKGDIENPSPLKIFRSGNEIGIGDSRLQGLRCPEFDATSRGFDNVIIDPIAMEGDDLTHDIFLIMNNNAKAELKSSRRRNEDPDFTTRMAAVGPYYYGITLELVNGDRDTAKLFIDSKSDYFIERQALACIIANRISEYCDGVGVIPVDLGFLEDDDPKQILKASQAGVYIQLQYKEIMTSYVNNPKTARALASALKEFLDES